MQNRGVFLDRDGTINEEVNYLNKIDQLKLIDGTTEAIRLLNNAGYKVVVITNQAAIARGYLTEEYLTVIHAQMEEKLREGNAYLDAIYYCPHHPTAGLEPYKVDCHCRKPRPGMLEQAASDLNIDLNESFIIGDKISDLGAGEAVGCNKILVRTGYGKETEKEILNYPLQPDYIANNLLEAVKWIVKQVGNQGRDINVSSLV